MSRCGRAGLALGAVYAAFALLAGQALALEIAPGGVTVATLDAAGRPDNRAGSHPDRLVASFELREGEGPEEGLRDLVLDLPPGTGGDPAAVPACPRAVFAELFSGGRECPPESEVGELLPTGEQEPTAVYAVEPAPSELALFGTQLFGMKLPVRQRGEDLGLSIGVVDSPNLGELFYTGAKVVLWGIPADHQDGTGIPRRALLTMPTRCDAGPFTMTMRARTWERPDSWLVARADTGYPLSGCADLPFEPAVRLALDDAATDAPSGAAVELAVPQRESPDGVASSQLRRASIALPEGMTISPAGAEGLRSCEDGAFGAGQGGAPACPASSRIGTVELTGPQFREPLSGALYLGAERPGERFRLFIYAAGVGAEAKMTGTLQADARTGRLTAVLDGLPEISFASMSLRLDGGPHALLATPTSCGAAVTAATFTPYSGSAPVKRQDETPVGQGSCPTAPFAPSLAAGASSGRAGKPTSFLASVGRRDGERLPSRLTIALPAGMSASLGGVASCAETAAATGACPEASRIGHAVAALGPGPDPARLPGQVYLTGPHRGAPFGVALAFAARLGPFDLGTLVVRGALRIDPLTGRVTIETDTLPRVFEGISVRFQEIGLAIDRPGFLTNPTACAQAATEARVSAAGGATSTPSSPFQVSGCIGLPFRPRFSMALRGDLAKGAHPSLRIGARFPKRGANLRQADLRLPSALRFDASRLDDICARGAAIAGRCPHGARIGSARAQSPLIETPLSGPLYVVQPQAGATPELWASLRGAGVRVEVRTQTGEADGRPEAKLREVPDVPLRRLTLRVAGGRHGVLALKRGLCRRAGRGLRVPARIEGQNRALRSQRLGLRVEGDCP